jgi:hypothetical protein
MKKYEISEEDIYYFVNKLKYSIKAVEAEIYNFLKSKSEIKHLSREEVERLFNVHFLNDMLSKEPERWQNVTAFENCINAICSLTIDKSEVVADNQILISCHSIKEKKYLEGKIINLLIKFREGDKYGK